MYIFHLDLFYFGMSQWEKFCWWWEIPKLPMKMTSSPQPMTRRPVDEIPQPCLWQSHFQECQLSFCQTSLQNKPQHFPNTVSFMMVLHCLREPMSQLMQEGWVVVWWYSGGGGDPLFQVESAEQSIDFSPTYIFILIALDCCPPATAFPSLNFSILHISKKVCFTLLRFPKVEFSNPSFCWMPDGVNTQL